ncbi:hypothetical protein LRE75_25190 [Streptomyces sp. 372A]
MIPRQQYCETGVWKSTWPLTFMTPTVARHLKVSPVRVQVLVFVVPDPE